MRRRKREGSHGLTYFLYPLYSQVPNRRRSFPLRRRVSLKELDQMHSLSGLWFSTGEWFMYCGTDINCMDYRKRNLKIGGVFHRGKKCRPSRYLAL